MEEQVSIKINSLQHIGIPVTDIIVSEAFYVRLGFNKVMQKPFDMDGKTGTCIMMKQGTILIELYQMPEHRLQEIRKRADGHIDHIAFDVEDIDSTFTALKEAQFHILEEEPVFLHFWDKGCRYFNILGPDGERLEFNQIL
jgi:catechol 2,3-dioxygenase-like lactoylglutathione lyase family enzyme